jgi:predicted DNA binding CopG/RHH family protein/uncharacterized DUF497 family protein
VYKYPYHILDRAIAGFDWDHGNLEKCQKHGVSVAEIEGLFTRPHAISVDVEHSLTEERLRAVGRARSGRSIFLVFTLRERDGGTYIRPVSARYSIARRPGTLKKKIPIFHSDEEAERFVDEADLTEYDFSQFKPVRFEFEKKAARVNMRLPETLLAAVKERARARGIPYQRFIREVLEQAVAGR